jgi:uncharacterized protein
MPTIVQLELVKWALRTGGGKARDRVLALSGNFSVVELDTAIAASAADHCLKYKLATADAIIYATAVACGADLLTCDAHFSGLPAAVYIKK